jgi:beta-lactamase class A
MPTAADPGPVLHSRLHEIESTLPDGALGVSVFDYLSGCAWEYDGGRWFHAASTIKVAILAAVFDAIDAGRFSLESRVHVRNFFRGATDGLPFRVQASRDANADVYASIGRTMRIGELARHMIASSSNLATNLLLDVTGLDAAKATLSRRGLSGIDLQRGVEDDRAHQAGCNNQVTANGLVGLLRAIRDADGFSEASSQAMLNVLFDQRFTGAIAPGLPDAVRAVARIAHKTGDISTASHDAGLVFLPGRPPYAIALLAESPGDAAVRTAALAAASQAVYDAILAAGEAACP